MKPLIQVSSFGGIDADVDTLLEECFQDHEAYQSAKNHERFLIIGRKGTGKTAIYRKLLGDHSYDKFAIGYGFADYPWHHHERQAAFGVPEEQRYLHSWKYLILLSASRVLLNDDHSQPWSEDAASALANIERFIVDSYGTRKPEITQFFEPSKHLRVTPSLAIPGGISEVGVSLERVAMNDLPRVVQDVNRTITDAVIRSLNPSHNYYVCFDQLDLGFSTTDPKYSQQLTGLILAARDISQRARDAGKRLTVAVFLRDDIYQLLKFEDKNKVTENSVSRIEWDESRSPWTLRALMERRFAAVLDIPKEQAWQAVFDENREMPGRQTKYEHIRDRTFRRPRDIIKFCNEVLRAYKDRQGSAKFENADVALARDSFSDYLLLELDDEIRKHVPDYENHLELLKSIGTLQFGIDAFRTICGKRADLTAGASPEAILRQLFAFSVVGYYKAGGTGGGSGYVFQYLEPRARFDEAAQTFRVHPGLKEALGLKRGGTQGGEGEQELE